MKSTAFIEKGMDETFCVYTSDLQHTIIGEGNTEAEAKTDFENSVKEVLASYTETKRPMPEELLGVEFEYIYRTDF